MHIVSLTARGAIDQIVRAIPIDIFRLLKAARICQLGEYRTQRLVLEAWDRLFGTTV